MKYGPLTSPITLSELRKHHKIFSIPNLVCPYPPKKTIISGGTVFAVFDLGQIAYQGPVRNVAICEKKKMKYNASLNREQAGEFWDLGRVILYALFFFCKLLAISVVKFSREGYKLEKVLG